MNGNDSNNNNNDKSASNVFDTVSSSISGSSSSVSGSGSGTSGTSGSGSGTSGFNYMNSWRQQITGMMDDQRLHRLQQCRILQTVLSDCRKSNNSVSSNSSSSKENDGATTTTTRQRKIELEDVAAGIRMVRYFNWRDWKEPSGTSDSEDTDSSNNNNSSKSNHCLREEHAVWACRSVALQCGAPLAQLKSCFTDAGADAVLDPSNQTAYEPDYEPKNNNSSGGSGAVQTAKTPCQWQQQALGDCVAAAAVQLQERQESSKASSSTSASTNTPGC